MPSGESSHRAPMQRLPGEVSGRLGAMLALDDFEKAAKWCLPRPIFGYYAGAAETNAAWRENRNGFAEYGLVPRYLRDVSKRSMVTTLFGRSCAAPFGIAPMGLSALATYRGDVVLARAAQEAGIPMIMSGSSLIPLEDVFSAAPESWFQAYLPGDWPRIEALIARIARAGYQTLVITVDVPLLGNRENNVRNGFSTPLRPTPRLAWDGLLRPGWLLNVAGRTLRRHGMPHFENNFATRGAPIIARDVARDFSAREHLDWSHLARIREMWKGKLVVKGILAPGDAVLAREHGCDGIVVSNHGGRQLDGAISPMRVLPEIAANAGDMVVMMDGGVRRGTDVLKALALGAHFVLVGRPFLFAAALAGQRGVAHAIHVLSEEIDRDMGLLGIGSLAEMTPDLLMRIGSQTGASPMG